MTELSPDQLSAVEGGAYSKEFFQGVIIGYEAMAIATALVGVFLL